MSKNQNKSPSKSCLIAIPWLGSTWGCSQFLFPGSTQGLGKAGNSLPCTFWCCWMRFVFNSSGRCLGRTGWASKSLPSQTILGFCYKTVFCKRKKKWSLIPLLERGEEESREICQIFFYQLFSSGSAFLDSISPNAEPGAAVPRAG